MSRAYSTSVGTRLGGRPTRAPYSWTIPPSDSHRRRSTCPGDSLVDRKCSNSSPSYSAFDPPPPYLVFVFFVTFSSSLAGGSTTHRPSPPSTEHIPSSASSSSSASSASSSSFFFFLASISSPSRVLPTLPISAISALVAKSRYGPEIPSASSASNPASSMDRARRERDAAPYLSRASARRESASSTAWSCRWARTTTTPAPDDDDDDDDDDEYVRIAMARATTRETAMTIVIVGLQWIDGVIFLFVCDNYDPLRFNAGHTLTRPVGCVG